MFTDPSKFLQRLGYEAGFAGELDAGIMTLRLLLAGLLGALVGAEREWRNRVFGLRTHCLVSIGSATFCMTVVSLIDSFDDESTIQMDPGRIVEGIIGGIGFLGAGAIIHGDRDVRGATTGAGIWVVGGIGVAVGFGYYLHATLLTVVILFVLSVLRRLSAWLEKAGRERDH
ncbi:MAG: MgtC/SapB family protein [Geminicoccaceae bacterium]|nr:MgtC/SapB family protein [Geminicoccaceae bacterium]